MLLSPLLAAGSTGTIRGDAGKALRHQQVGRACANGYTETRAGFHVVCVPRVASAPLLALLGPPVPFLGTETATTTSGSDPVQESTEAPVKVTLTVTATP